MYSTYTMKSLIYILAVIVCSLNSFAQTTFFRIFSDVDAAKNLSGQHLVKTIDGNYSFLCTNNILPVIIRIDENGNEFNRFSVEKYRLNPVCLAVDNQFNYYFVGRDSALFTGYREKTDSLGNLIFHTGEYGAVGNSQAHGVFQTPDNGMLYSFWNNSEMCYDPEYFSKYDSLNSIEWTRDISSNMSNSSKQSFQFLSPDEICAVGPHLIGCYDTIQYYSSDLRIFDTTGNYANYNFNELYHSVDTTYGRGFIMASENEISHFDTIAGVLWTNPMPSGMSFQIALRQLSDSSFILAGDRLQTNLGQQIMIRKYDWSGNVVWTKYFGESGDEFFSNMLLTDDGGFLISGTTNSYGSGPKAFLIKADSLGNSMSMPMIIASTNKICSGDSTALTLPAGYTYLWNTGDTSQTIYATTSNSYWAELNQGGNLFYSDTISLNVVPTVKPQLGSDTTLCAGSILILDAGINYSAYRWSTGSFDQMDTVANSGNYFVETIDSNSCSMFDTIQVSFISLPFFDLGPDINQCGLNPVVLNSPGILQWVWSDGSTDTTLSVTSSGVYSLTFTNGLCSDTDNIVVNIFSPVQVDLPEDTVLCTNQILQLDAGTGFINYEWQDGSQAQTYNVSSASVATIQYTVTTIDSNGCSTSDDIVVDFEICPSTNDLSLRNGISIYPNPINSSHYLQFDSSVPAELITEIISLTGIQLYKHSAQITPFKIVVNDFSSGLYFLKITDQKTGDSFSTKLIVE
jgi:hypothetical protein